jgi:hypothetical protein
MWVCPECSKKNIESYSYCWNCGIALDDAEKPILITKKDILYRPSFIERPRQAFFDSLPKAVGVPRQFSVGTMMVFMTFFAVIFSIMTMLGAESPIFTGVTVFFVGVGAGQMFLFRGRDPRKSSLLSGVVMGIVSSILVAIMSWIMHSEGKDDYQATVYCILFVIFGGPLGYLAGGLIAGIFLFREREKQAEADAVKEEKLDMPQ